MVEGNPPQLWSIQILTADYLIDGRFDSQDVNGIPFFNAPSIKNGDCPIPTLTLTSALLQSTGSLALPTSAIGRWTFSPQGACVAVIPRDEASSAYVLKNSRGQNPVPADVYVGPYLVRGIVMSPVKELALLASYPSFFVQHARITCLVAGTRMEELTSPNIIVSTSLLQGIVPHA